MINNEIKARIFKILASCHELYVSLFNILNGNRSLKKAKLNPLIILFNI